MSDEVGGENLWDEISFKEWKATPHIKNRIAKEQDVKNGLAVFYIDESQEEHVPLDIQLPALAYQRNNESEEDILVVIIQGERVGDDEILGIRYFNGGNGICMLSELTITNLEL